LAQEEVIGFDSLQFFKRLNCIFWIDVCIGSRSKL